MLLCENWRVGVSGGGIVVAVVAVAKAVVLKGDGEREGEVR